MTKIGTGYISVDADLNPFWRQVDRELAGLDARFKKVGRSSGASFGDGFSGSLRDISGLRSSLAGLDRDSRRAQKGFSGLAASFGGSGGNIGKVARNLDNFGGAANGATATIGGFKIAIAGLVPVLISFSGATIAAASSLAPLAGLAAAAGNGLAAAAQGLGVFKLATAGISDALKEQTTNQIKAGGAAASQAGQQRSAARAIQSAQDGIHSALEGVTSAQDDVRSSAEQLAQAETAVTAAQKDAIKVRKALAGAYTEARRAIVDMHAALIDAASSEQHAVLELQDATKALAALQAGATQEQLADASRSVTESMHGQQQAVINLQRAQESLDALMGRSAVTEQQRAGAAQALARAQQNLAVVEADANATYDERTHALQLVADATTTANAANAAATVTELDRRQAIQDVTSAQDALTAAQAEALKAQQALATLQAGPSDEDKRKALLDVQDAEQQLIEARRERLRQEKDTAAADQTGIAGSQQVVDAKAAIAEADQRVTDAEAAVRDAHRDVTRAQQGLADANTQVQRATLALADAQLAANESMEKGASSAAALNQKFDALSPAAQKFVLHLKDLKPKFDELRATAASGFFPGVTAGLDAAMGSFGSVKKVIGETAVVLGDAAKKSGELVGSPAFGKDIETIGHNNAKVIGTLGEALRHVISALRNVAVAAGPLTQWLADLANKWALNAAQAAKAGRENGKMAAFFERTRAITQRLSSILGHLASGLLGVGKAGTQSGNQIWASIDRAATRFDDWANSTDGQNALKDFFQRSKELAGALLPVLTGIVGAIGTLALKTLPLTTALRLLGPYAGEATTAFVAYKFAVIAVGIAERIATAAVWAHNAAIAIQSVNMIRWRILLAAAAIQSGVMTAAQWALNTAMDANPIGLVVTAIAALVAGFIYAWHNSETFRTIITAAFDAVKGAAEAVFGWITQNWPLLFAIITGPVGLAVSAVKQSWVTLKLATQEIWNAIKATLTTIWAAIRTAAVVSWEAIKTAILTPIRGARDVIGDVVTGIANRLASGWEIIKSAASGAWNAVRELVLTPIRAARDLLPDVMTGIANRVQAGWDAVMKGIKAFAGDAKDSIVGAFEGAANLVIDFVNVILKAINLIPGVPNIGLIDHVGGDDKKKKAAASKGGPNGTGRLAQGGAFGRTGGLVTYPITLMGEEAPAHPEFVIPTNPAYRLRAQMLLAQAAGAIGLARGGRYSQTDMENLWAKHGGGDKKIAGAVGMAESAGDPNAANGPYHGLWQVGPGGSFDPDQNAIQAIAKWRAGGSSVDARWKPWEAYTGPDGVGSDGPWRKFANGGGGGGILGAIGGALNAVGGVLGDLLSKGASFILNKLPGVGDLPDWLKGTGNYALDKAGDWIKDKVAGLVGAGGAGGAAHGPKGVGVFEGVPMANWVIDALNYGRAHGAHGHPTSGYRPGFDPHTASGRSEHQGIQYPHGAVDFGSFTTGLAEKMSYVNATRGFKYPLLAPIGFRDDGHASGTGHKMGGIYGGLPYAGSFGNGGIVPGPVGQPVTVIAHGGEAITQNGADLIAALNAHTAELRHLNQSGVSGVMSSITDHVLIEGGDRARRRSQTASRGVTALIA